MKKIKPFSPDQAVVFSCGSNLPLAEKIASHLNIKLGPLIIKKFSDGEIWVKYEESIRGKDVFLIQSTINSDAIMELLISINAAKLAKARRTIAVVPYFGYARQDKKDESRVAMSAALVCQLIETAGATAVILSELHNAAILGSFRKTQHDHLYLTQNMWPLFQNIKNPIVVSTDAGSSRMARFYGEQLKTMVVYGTKIRDGHNKVKEIKIVGDEVKGKSVIVPDDMGDTMGTVEKTIETVMAKGALEAYAALVHPIFSGNALKIINSTPGLKKIITTNTIDLSPEKRCDKIIVVDVSSIFAAAISRFHYEESIDSLFQQ